PMPDSLSQQISYIHRAVDAFAIPVVKCEGFEADDLIGTLALQAVAAEVEVVIVTADKDMFQLLSPSIQIYDPVKDKVLLVKDCPVSFDRQLFRLGEARAEELAALFRELEFWGLLKALQSNGRPEKTQRPPVAVIADSLAAKSLAHAIEAAGAMALQCELS